MCRIYVIIMSRSKKKIPIVKCCRRVTKGQSSRRLRLHTKKAIRNNEDLMPDGREITPSYEINDYVSYWPEGGRKATQK